MSTYADNFITPIRGVNEALNAGSVLLVSNLTCTETEPTVIQVQVASGSTPASGNTTLSLTIASGATTATLRKGLVLHFPGNKPVTVKTQTDITSSGNTTVPINALGGTNIPAGQDIASSWCLLKVLSPTNIPVNIEDTMVDRTDLDNEGQKADSKATFKLTSQVTLINDPKDKAFWNVLYPASTSNNQIFAFIARNNSTCQTTVNDRLVWGSALVSANTSDGNIDEIDRPQVTLNFQPPWAAPTLRAYLSASLQADFDTVRKLAGLAIA